ncbi:uncharacterized protein LOC128867566 [Anastrepha ludens]|uniref:uncharacterized protein LOC128867566 n=1 Tax=Anastrepha ludens TaxID=28586 RepID=UPI0023AF6FF6|nr:uncharacterized protein LOC128867566 [Anastrepha ludens]XP_053964903.1 uncharacterized protein LOC128867566 [Anastrepha ludens]XP_053964904.1 uncharacterized protein LOC128867566 [Anastrepha ludens]XP_053964905.1 uncharacterized protein LOC128867566 [Anastrepha ludens]
MEPTSNLVKLESCDLEAEIAVPNTMHNNHYEPDQSSYHNNNNRQYGNYQSYIHNMQDANSINKQRQIPEEEHVDQIAGGNSIIKSETEYIAMHVSDRPANSSTQLSYVDGSNETDLHTMDSDDIPVIVNGKYFRIIEEMNATEHQRVTRGIVAVCQHCSREKARPIHGSMRITSNFVRHLKTLHPERYEEFIIERQNHSRTPRGRRGHKRKINQPKGQNGNNSRTEGYMMDDESNAYSPEGNSAYYDDTQLSSGNNLYNADNTDMYSAESNDTHLSDESMEKKGSSNSCQIACDPNEIPTILNGKYFKIIEQDMHSNRASISVVAACQFCDADKLVKGPLKVTSNFVQHLRSRHFKEYNMYLKEKFNSSTRCRRSLNKQPAPLPFIEKVLNFILLSNVPVSVVEESAFIELFRGTGQTMCSRAQLLARLDDTHACFVDNVKHSLQEVPYICVTADIWTRQNKQYFGYCSFWLDNELRRQMAVLACIRLSDAPTYNEIQTVIGQIQAKYDLSEEKITCTVVDGVRDFVQTYHNFSIKSMCNDYYDDDFNFAISCAQHLLNHIPKQLKRGEHSLHLLTVFDFNNILKSHEMLQDVLRRCLDIFRKCRDFEVDEIAGCLFDGRLAQSDVRWPTWYISLTQFLKHKNKLDELCTSLNASKFAPHEIEYLEDLCMILKPITDALEFLQQDSYLYFGYFLPTLVTIKVKLKKLHECSRIKHLHIVARQLSDALLNRFGKYFEMNSECNDAIIAAIVCPAVKMRFVEALRETAPHVNTEMLMVLFVDYAQDFYENNEKTENTQAERPPSVDSFLCFDPDDNEDTPSKHRPSVAIREELTSYLHDEDKTLACLNRYPLVKKVFHKYNTLLPTSLPLENFFHTFLNVFDGQKREHLNDEHMERLVLTKTNKVL